MGAPEVQFPCEKISRTYRSRMCKLAMRQALRLSKIMCIFVCHVASRPLSKTRRARLDVRGRYKNFTHICGLDWSWSRGGDKTLTLLFCRIPRGACLGRSARECLVAPPPSDACSSSSSSFTSPVSSGSRRLCLAPPPPPLLSHLSLAAFTSAFASRPPRRKTAQPLHRP